MEKTITELLKKKYPELSTAILNWLVEKLQREAKTEEEATKLVEELTSVKIAEGYADMRATQATRSAVENYEKKYNLKDGEKREPSGGGAQTNPTNEPKPNDNDTPAWAKALIKQNEELRDEINAMKVEKTKETRMEAITQLVQNLPEGLKKGYLLTNYETLSEEDFEAVKKEIEGGVAEYDKTFKAAGARLPEPPPFGGGKKDELPSDEESKNFLKQMGIKNTSKE